MNLNELFEMMNNVVDADGGQYWHPQVTFRRTEKDDAFTQEVSVYSYDTGNNEVSVHELAQHLGLMATIDGVNYLKLKRVDKELAAAQEQVYELTKQRQELLAISHDSGHVDQTDDVLLHDDLV